MPLPYVAATRTLGELPTGAALNWVTGAYGSRVPKLDQQLLLATEQLVMECVADTPTSVAT